MSALPEKIPSRYTHCLWTSIQTSGEISWVLYPLRDVLTKQDMYTVQPVLPESGIFFED